MTSLLWVLAAAVSLGPSDVQDQVLKLEDGSELRYATSTQKDHAGGKPQPLILALHYGWVGELPPGYGRMYMNLLVAPTFAELNAIIVAPEAPEPSWTHPRSEGALLALIDHIRKTHSVDSTRIVVTGYSLGAMGAWFMASRHPDLFSALIPMAGPPVLHGVGDALGGLMESKRFLGEDKVDWPPSIIDMPIFAIHSRKDELVEFELVSRAVKSLRGAGGQVEFVKVKDLGHFDTAKFVPHLTRAVPWLRGIWESAKEKRPRR